MTKTQIMVLSILIEVLEENNAKKRYADLTEVFGKDDELVMIIYNEIIGEYLDTLVISGIKVDYDDDFVVIDNNPKITTELIIDTIAEFVA